MENYEAHITQLRKQREERVAATPLEWIDLVGLFWLEEGENSFGSSPTAKICLPKFPQAICGYFLFKNGQVSVHPTTTMTLNGGAVESRPLRTDKDEHADLIEIGSLTMKIIVRGDVTLVRVWDRDSENRRKFNEFNYYPPNPEYKITATYIRYNPPKPTIRVEGIGTEIATFFMGRAEFKLNGIVYTLEAEQSGENLLFNFKDETNADTTYGGGRRFYLPPPTGDQIVLDFNLTENWPCAYTAFATCPIPPKENKLNVRIEAGEKFKGLRNKTRNELKILILLVSCFCFLVTYDSSHVTRSSKPILV
jgi:uncharacterized protein